MCHISENFSLLPSDEVLFAVAKIKFLIHTGDMEKTLV
jgi:hypothetical protein